MILRRPPVRQLAEIELGLIDILAGFAWSAQLAEHMAWAGSA